jgi:hypothetical protein
VRFYTNQECEAWLEQKERQKPDQIPDMQIERINYPKQSYGLAHVARWISNSNTYNEPCLLWITEWRIWPSSENLHLYYRLRGSYGDQRLLEEAPGHLFLGYETSDLASFLQVAMLNGWEGYILTSANYVNAFFSHDEYIDFFAKLDYSFSDLKEALVK